MKDQQIFLLPGELYVTREPITIATLLGSCVAICLYNRRYNFGGMNHYMLASAPAGEVPSLRHGDYSSEMLIDMMRREDGILGNLEAFVIGGGKVTGHLSVGRGIGAANIAAAKEILEKNNIRIAKTSIGGDFGRKVHFQSWDGQIDIRKIQKSAVAKDIQTKKQALSSRKIKVLVVDDSSLIRTILKKIISADPGIEVVGCAANAFEAREMLLEFDPDVITLDIIMPKINGITFLKKIFLYKPKPVIVISTVTQKDSKIREQAESIGAVDVIDKEDLNLYQGMEKASTLLTGKIKMAATTLLHKKTQEELKEI